jgi:hypothetical protein
MDILLSPALELVPPDIDGSYEQRATAARLGREGA